MNLREVSSNIAESTRVVQTLMFSCNHDQIWRKKLDTPKDTINVLVIYLIAKGLNVILKLHEIIEHTEQNRFHI